MKHKNYLILMFLAWGTLLVSCTKVYKGNYGDVVIKDAKCAQYVDMTTNASILCITKHIALDSADPNLYFIRGEQYCKLLKFTSAMFDFIKVVEVDQRNLDAYYAVVSTASLAYQKEYALHWLQKAIESGFNDYERIFTDPSLDYIRSTKEFKQLMEKLNHKLSSMSKK